MMDSTSAATTMDFSRVLWMVNEIVLPDQAVRA